MLVGMLAISVVYRWEHASIRLTLKLTSQLTEMKFQVHAEGDAVESRSKLFRLKCQAWKEAFRLTSRSSEAVPVPTPYP